MVRLVYVPAMSEALKKVCDIVKKNEEAGRKTLIFCEDNLTLVLENAVCDALGGGFFDPFIYSFSLFLSSNGVKASDVLSPQGSAMVLRRIIEHNKDSLSCFKKLSTPGAAAAVYDTISLLYSSHVDVEDLRGKEIPGALLKRKLGDICFLYEKYFEYLDQNGVKDKNTYLSLLPEVLRGSGALETAMNGKTKKTDVVFVGYQSFSYTASLTLSVCMARGGDTYGVLISGEEPLYTNDARDVFRACGAETGGIAERYGEEETRIRLSLPEAETLRSRLFDAASFGKEPVKTDRVHLFEAADPEEELEYVAAKIKQITASGERYANISLMMPDLDSNRPLISRIFTRYDIPYYIDGRLPLTACPICSFVCDLFSCRTGGYYPDAVDAVISNPLFNVEGMDDDAGGTGDVTLGAADGAEQKIVTERRRRDEARNYVLRLAHFRGGITRPPDEETCKNLGFDYGLVCGVRERLMSLVELIPKEGTGDEFFAAVRKIMEIVGAERKLAEIAENFRDGRPTESMLYARAFSEAMGDVDEASSLLQGDTVKADEFLRLVRSGFYADKVSLIPPKEDAVFVGDISRTLNIGTNYLFAAGMTNAVPSAETDTSVLSEREINDIERVSVLAREEEKEKIFGKDAEKKEEKSVKITPKLSAVNARYRETAALNLCSFKKQLYVSRPVRQGGKDDATPSEILSYITSMFVDMSGEKLKFFDMAEACKDPGFLAFLCGEKTAALKVMLNGDAKVSRTVEKFLKDRGYAGDVARASSDEERKDFITCGDELFMKDGAVNPTTLEEWFSCPYKAFLDKGVGLTQRKTAADAALDVGNFVHRVLQDVFAPMLPYGEGDEEKVAKKARETGEKLISRPPYSSLLSQKSGQYTAAALIEEAVTLSRGAYRQLMNCDFDVEATEAECRLDLGDGYTLKGKIDRVDTASDGSLVRVIDYKTGDIEASAKKYYLGQKLQLELYLFAATGDKIPAGAYYFPASVTFSDEDETGGTFPLTGFMNGDRPVVEMSDKSMAGMAAGTESEYLDSVKLDKYTGGAMKGEDFGDFLEYGRLVARRGADEMSKGFICPAPAEGVCDYCAYHGLCGHSESRDGAARTVYAPKSEDVARIAREAGTKAREVPGDEKDEGDEM
ncbi:MAG: PD-(D/E)XK nuclease family protein [Clostridia bacterium]|nr:PD-(D/E)XK nuclease family protein [Clostridia bacterium]